MIRSSVGNDIYTGGADEFRFFEPFGRDIVTPVNYMSTYNYIIP
jgi:hypothetical protein